MTPTEAAVPITDDLRKVGYKDLQVSTVLEVIAAWEAGKRGMDLPHGGLGRLVERNLARRRASGEVT